MPPSTVNVRNGWPTTASTTASQIQMLVATMKPSRAPSRSESCLTGIVGSAALRRAAFVLAEERGDQRDQRRGLERLRDEAIGAQGHGVPPDIDGSRALDARHRDDLHRGPLAAESADRLQPPLPGHEDVHDHDVSRVALVRADPGVAVRSLADLVADVLQILRQGLPQRDVVVDDEYAGHVERGAGRNR